MHAQQTASRRGRSSRRLRRSGNFAGSTPLLFHDVNPVLTPNVRQSDVDWAPLSSSRSAHGRYVGKSYLDNTNDETLTTPSFATLDLSSDWALGGGARVRLQVNNVLNNKRVFPAATAKLHSAEWWGDGVLLPQATRNAVVM